MTAHYAYRKMDHEIRIENPLNRLIAIVSTCEVKVLSAVTHDELKEIAWVSENFERLITSLVEE